MSHIPSTAMKHAHADTAPTTPAAIAKRVVKTAEHHQPPLWTMVAAGVAGAVATAAFFTLRSSAPAEPPKARRKPVRAKKKTD